MVIHFENWLDAFLDNVKTSRRLRIVSPFVKDQIIQQLYLHNPSIELELVTRFNLSDFALGLSSLNALRFALHNRADIFGVAQLHSKLYLFDNRKAIISSANLTSGGLMHNFECGIEVSDKPNLRDLNQYFNRLKSFAEGPLSEKLCDQWASLMPPVEELTTPAADLHDYGGSQSSYDDTKAYYVKFFGSSDRRKPFDYSVRNEIERGLSHYACGFPENKKPRQIKDGDVIYLARLTEPANFAIFGKAEAIKYVEWRDRFTKEEIKARDWKANWPVCLRYRNPVFVDGVLGDCVTLYDLMDTLQHSSFPTTQARFDDGERMINPYRSLSQQPYVRLTQKAVQWLEPRFQGTLNRNGVVPKRYLNSLPQSPIII